MDELQEKIDILNRELEDERERGQAEIQAYRMSMEDMRERLQRAEYELEHYYQEMEQSKTRVQEASPFVFEDIRKYQQESQQLNQRLKEQNAINERLQAELIRLKQRRKKKKKQEEPNNKNNDNVEIINSGPPMEHIDTHYNHNNGWTNETDTILLNWKLSTSKNLFIYGFIFDRYKTKLENFLIYSMISTALGTLLAGVSTLVLGLSEQNTVLVWIGFGLSFAILITDLLATVFNGIMTIKKYPEFTTRLSGYIEKLNGFYAIISSVYMMPLRLRLDGNNFIKKENESYVELVQNAPSIGIDDYIDGDAKFDEFSKRFV